jgi:hypothetical protein
MSAVTISFCARGGLIGEESGWGVISGVAKHHMLLSSSEDDDRSLFFIGDLSW